MTPESPYVGVPALRSVRVCLLRVSALCAQLASLFCASCIKAASFSSQGMRSVLLL